MKTTHKQRPTRASEKKAQSSGKNRNKQGALSQSVKKVVTRKTKKKR
jgi:hypothetical protein